MKLGIGLTKGLNLMPKGLITNLNHNNSFVRGPMLVFVWVYPIKKIFYIYISVFFHKKTCLSKYRALAGDPPRPPLGRP
ncbi:hypothetical protein HanPI659440_Chr14g0565961 [Helianthus annuus]|nr:hypothetical protein HanPI659440_Chr14g0565961 [Helianthus annuus]